MAGIVASASKGVIDSVLAKLNELIMGDMRLTNLLGVSRTGICYLWDELSAMNALLEKLEDADELDPQAKNWRNQVRELTYDIEDWIDEFAGSEGSDDARAGFISRISQFLRTLRSRVKAAEQIKDLKTRLQEIHERRKRYKFEECSSGTKTIIDSRVPALYAYSNSLVGIENPKEELIEVIDKAQQFKVVAIVGFGGLGKTTLANEVYREVGRQFNSKAFVTISQKPNVARILKCTLSQLEPNTYSNARDVRDLINNIREILQDKRFFIIVDDLWDIRVWNIINCAFPQNSQHSMVMITTRNVDVARECCRDHGFIYNMKVLSEQDSRNLFFNRIFGSKYENPQFTEVSCEILKKCGGLPLAIITVASILACQPVKLKEHWEHIQNSLATRFATKSNFEDMMHILDLSYKNLPCHLKACFLYLGTYPEDHKISKVELIRRWVAEGFVSNSGQDGWYVAESYFNELVNRSMIQPAYEDYCYDIDEVSHCRLHDMMLELIVRRCKEGNFMSFAHDHRVMAEGQDRAIRRLTVKMSDTDDGVGAMATTCHLSPVRSLAIFGRPNWNHWILLLREFKLLRVLYLDIYRCEMTMDLSGINQLAQLRYLKVGNERSFRGIPVMLPGKIQRLRHLETLELPALSVCRILSDIVHLPCLSHLVVPHDTELPDGIGKVKSLRTVDGFDLSRSSLENINALGELTNLRDLSLHCHTESWEYASALGDSLMKLRNNLKRLSVSCTFAGRCADTLEHALRSLDNLELLDMSGCTFMTLLEPVELWDSNMIAFSRKLRQLRLGVSEIFCGDIISMIGGDLPSLVEFHLRSPGAVKERIVISSKGFMQLKVFELECDGISYLTFEEGAMPRLQKLCLAFDPSAWDKTTPVGIQHLSSLKQIHVLTVRNSSTAASVSEAPSTSMSETAEIRGAFQEVADAHPGRPEFTLGEAWLIRDMESRRAI